MTKTVLIAKMLEANLNATNAKMTLMEIHSLGTMATVLKDQPVHRDHLLLKQTHNTSVILVKQIVKDVLIRTNVLIVLLLQIDTILNKVLVSQVLFPQAIILNFTMTFTQDSTLASTTII